MIEWRQASRQMPSTAAEWFAARAAGRADPALEQAFETWLAADPERRRQYALCEIAWDLSRPAAENLLAAPPGMPDRTSVIRRRGAHGIGLAASLLITVAAIWYVAAGREPVAMRYVTGAGEQRTVVLGDGSRITLNTRTGLEAEVTRSRRAVVLESGEAFFEVARDPSRPFRVLTSLGEVTVVGTRFSVYRRSESVEVTTEHGLVQVSPTGLPESTAAVFVRPGERAVIAATDRRPRLQPADLRRIDNWRHQRLEFDAVPLAELLDEFSRYTAVRVQPANPQIGAVRVSGVFHIGDVEALSKTLRAAFGLVVRTSGGGPMIVEPGGATATARQ